jgi:hypothetical protein
MTKTRLHVRGPITVRSWNAWFRNCCQQTAILHFGSAVIARGTRVSSSGVAGPLEAHITCETRLRCSEILEQTRRQLTSALPTEDTLWTDPRSLGYGTLGVVGLCSISAIVTWWTKATRHDETSRIAYSSTRACLPTSHACVRTDASQRTGKALRLGKTILIHALWTLCVVGAVMKWCVRSYRCWNHYFTAAIETRRTRCVLEIDLPGCSSSIVNWNILIAYQQDGHFPRHRAPVRIRFRSHKFCSFQLILLDGKYWRGNA